MIIGASYSIYKPLMVHTVSFLSHKQLYNFMQTIIFQVPSQARKYEGALQGETSIAAQVSHDTVLGQIVCL